MFPRMIAWALALCAPAFAPLTFAASAPASAATPAEIAEAEVVKGTTLTIARNGNEVLVSWLLPKADIKQLEIFRNTRDQAPGRGRVAAVRTEPPVYYDTVAEAETTYWYWLKITLKSGQTVNIGPAPTPAAKVWVP